MKTNLRRKKRITPCQDQICYARYASPRYARYATLPGAPRYADRSEYVGPMLDGWPHGNGTLQWPVDLDEKSATYGKRITYVGDFERGQMSGYGHGVLRSFVNRELLAQGS